MTKSRAPGTTARHTRTPRTLRLGFSLLAVFAGGCAGCGGGPAQTLDPSEDGITAVDVRPDSVALTVGQNTTLKATLRAGASDSTDPAPSGDDRAIQWVSSHPSVSTVSNTGVVTAVAPGAALISASIEALSDTALVVVVEPDPVPEPTGEQARRADDFVNSVGVQLHLGHGVYRDRLQDIIKPKLVRLGVRHVRDEGHSRSDMRPLDSFYGRIRDVGALGIKFTLILWERDRALIPFSAISYDDASHADDVAQAAGSALEALEILNEHDATGPGWEDRVRRYTAATWQEVQQNPKLRHLDVVGPAFGGLASFAAAGDLSAYMDYGTLHPYPGGEPPTRSPPTTLQEFINASRAMNGSRPVVVTETGYHTAIGSTKAWMRPVSEIVQRKYVPRLLFVYFNADVTRTFLYELIDQGANLSQQEMSFGLLRNNGSEKPAFTAVANLTSLLADPGAPFAASRLDYALGGETADLQHTLLQKRNGRFYLALWLEIPSSDTSRKQNVTVTFAKPVQEASVYRPATSAAPTERFTLPLTLQLEVTDDVLILEVAPVLR